VQSTVVVNQLKIFTLSYGLSERIITDRGPMIVTAVCSGDTYKIADLNSEGKQLYATTAHISALKRFATDHGKDSEPELSDPDEPAIINTTDPMNEHSTTTTAKKIKGTLSEGSKDLPICKIMSTN